MKAMILAAGLGKRMRPLTDHLPKPLIPVANQTLIEHQIERLVAAGIKDIVINISYLADKIRAHLGDGSRYNAQISYSQELTPLETAGGIAQALPLLGDEPFLLVNSDVWCDYPLKLACEYTLPPEVLGHMVMVPNPAFKVSGDFDINSAGLLQHRSDESVGLTFSGISILNPELIASYPKKRQTFALKEVFDWALEQNALGAELHRGVWMDIGTPERLKDLEEYLAGQ